VKKHDIQNAPRELPVFEKKKNNTQFTQSSRAVKRDQLNKTVPTTVKTCFKRDMRAERHCNFPTNECAWADFSKGTTGMTQKCKAVSIHIPFFSRDTIAQLFAHRADESSESV
jgi:hypothetical protein